MEIRLLGELTVLREGRAVPLPASRKTRALLAYLVATGRPHPRERLCEIFWDGPDDPRASLRWSLTKLRPVVDEPRRTRLVADRERVAFEARGVEVDLTAARALVGERPAEASAAALAAAAGHLRGELLEGLDVVDCFRYHEWCVGEREAARALRLAVLDALVAKLRDRPAEALPWARARLAIDPLIEAAHLPVISLLGALGRSAEAMRQYVTCCRLLEKELGARPSPALERARMALRAPPIAVAAPVAPSPGPAPPVAAPLIGRAEERALLERHIAAAAAARGQGLLLLVGEPGIGKSRLLEELGARVRGAGGLVLVGRAFDAEMVRPYGAWIDAIRSVHQDRLDDRLREHLAPLLPELGDAQAGGDRARLFDGVTHLLGRLSDSTPLALVLDDLHWFDEASAALLHYVTRTLGEARVVLAGAARPGELADNPAALRLLRALGRDGRLTQLRLGPLGVEETAALAATVGAEIDAAHVFGESAGNPLYALEVARALHAGEGALSRSLDDRIADRLEHLDERTRELLPWAAAFGHGFDAELLAHATGWAPGEIAGATASLERHGVLRVVGGETGTAWDFAHDLIRRAAYRQLSAPRRRLVHQRIGQALGTLPDPDGALAADVAHHASAGGDFERAALACVAAGQRCLRMFARAEASELASRGLGHLERVPRDRRPAPRLALLRVKVDAGVVAWRRGRDQLETALRAAVAEALQAGRQDEAAHGLYSLSLLHYEAGDFGHAHDASRDLEATARRADPATAAFGLANAGVCLLHLERNLPRAGQLLREAEALAASQRLEVPDIALGFGLEGALVGDPEEARARLERALALVRRLEDHWREFICLRHLVTLELEQGRFDAALLRLDGMRPVIRRLGEGSEGPISDALEALARHGLGQDVETGIERAVEGLRAVDATLAIAYVLTCAAELDLDAGRAGAAVLRATSALAAAEVVARPSALVAARAALARAAEIQGDTAAAAAHVQAALIPLAHPDGVNPRTRARLAQIAHSLGMTVPER